MYFKRDIDKKLLKHFSQENPTPLIVRGAPDVGKFTSLLNLTGNFKIVKVIDLTDFKSRSNIKFNSKLEPRNVGTDDYTQLEFLIQSETGEEFLEDPTVVDNQNTINVELYQGNTKIPEEAAYLGNITITGIDSKPAGEPNISVDVSVDVNGVLRCKTIVDNFSRDITLELKSDVHAKTLTREEKRIIKWRNGISEIKDKA